MRKLFSATFLGLVIAEDPMFDFGGRKAMKGKEHQYIEGCSKDHANLAVADFRPQSQKEFDEFKAKNKSFVVGLSDSTCPECCRSEPILAEL